MTRTGAMVVLASCAIVASAARGQAVARTASVELTGEAAHVLRATTATGAVAELRGRMTIRFSGRHASIRLPSGLTASARTRDVTLTLREDVSVSTASTRSPSSITLRRGANVETESIDARGARVRVATLSVTLQAMRVRASALHLDPVEVAPVRPIECRVGYAPGYPRDRGPEPACGRSTAAGPDPARRCRDGAPRDVGLVSRFHTRDPRRDPRLDPRDEPR